MYRQISRVGEISEGGEIIAQVAVIDIGMQMDVCWCGDAMQMLVIVEELMQRRHKGWDADQEKERTSHERSI